MKSARLLPVKKNFLDLLDLSPLGECIIHSHEAQSSSIQNHQQKL